MKDVGIEDQKKTLSIASLIHIIISIHLVGQQFHSTIIFNGWKKLAFSSQQCLELVN